MSTLIECVYIVKLYCNSAQFLSFSNVCISKGSLATHLRCGGNFFMYFCCKLIPLSSSERIFEIRLPKTKCHFLWDTVYTKDVERSVRELMIAASQFIWYERRLQYIEIQHDTDSIVTIVQDKMLIAWHISGMTLCWPFNPHWLTVICLFDVLLLFRYFKHFVLTCRREH